jgi:FtsH-binding integral membrane protein
MSQNPFEAPQYNQWTTADLAAVDERTAFIRNTYLHLVVAILVFVAIEAIALTVFAEPIARLTAMVTQGYMWLVFMGGVMLISYIADSWAQSNTSRSMQYMGLTIYVLANAIMFLPLLSIAERVAPNAIPSAGILTLAVFGGLSAVVFLTKADFSFLRYGLWVLGFAALGLIVASIFFGFGLGIWFSAAMVLYAAGMILYSTSNVLHHYNTNQHVAASLALFASIALMLWYVIQLFMYLDD